MWSLITDQARAPSHLPTNRAYILNPEALEKNPLVLLLYSKAPYPHPDCHPDPSFP